MLNRKDFFWATAPYWVALWVILLLAKFPLAGFIAHNPAAALILVVIGIGFTIWFLKGQRARCEDVGFSKWISIAIVLGVFAAGKLLDMYYAPSGTILSYAFPTLLFFVPTGFARK